MYDLLIVGAGITAATLAAKLKQQLRICVLDCRTHIGGNCFDESCQGTQIHRYGPHIFHCPSPRIISFLDAYTDWVPYTHRVVAEVSDGLERKCVPFPYCRETIKCLGRELSESEVLEAFFRGYSQKMWGMNWEELPPSVRGRIPREPSDVPVYYRDPFVALPKRGYTHMIANMLDGVEIVLGAPPTEWLNIHAKQIVYTGRPDLIPLPRETVPIAHRKGLVLDYRALDIEFSNENWTSDAISVHACTLDRNWTRKTCYARMTGGHSKVVSTEFPRQAAADELAPYYPIELEANRSRFVQLAAQVKEFYPHLHLAGRLGCYRYFDMYQAVGNALTLCEKLSRDCA